METSPVTGLEDNDLPSSYGAFFLEREEVKEIVTGLEENAKVPSEISSGDNSLLFSSRHFQQSINVWQDFDVDEEDDDFFWGRDDTVGTSVGYTGVANIQHQNSFGCIKSSNQNALDEAEQLIQRLKVAEETDLINLDASVDDLVEIRKERIDEELVGNFDSRKPTTVSSPIKSTLNSQVTSLNSGDICGNDATGDEVGDDYVNPNLLPRCAIIYDYTTQPVIAKEQRRHFLPHFGTSSTPFLRPIVIDGVGLVKAFRNCCCTNTTYFPFPIVPILRCMFYWISKGHSTVLCFPSMFNPLQDGVFNATVSQKEVLQRLRRFKMCTIFETSAESDNKIWYSSVLEHHRSCLITTISQWRLSMPNNLVSGVVTRSDSFSNYSFNQGRAVYGMAYPERLLQPFFSHEGKLVFFSSFSSQGTCVADMILDSSVISSEDFERLNGNQMSFVEQARMLKVLYTYVPETSRFRETTVMVKVLERLKPFLP